VNNDNSIVSVTFINKTNKLWYDFMVAQLNTEELNFSDFNNFTMKNLIHMVTGDINDLSVHDFNTDKISTMKLDIGQPTRLLGIMPPNDPEHPLRSVVNLDPVIIKRNGPKVFEVFLNNDEDRLIIRPINDCKNKYKCNQCKNKYKNKCKFDKYNSYNKKKYYDSHDKNNTDKYVYCEKCKKIIPAK